MKKLVIFFIFMFCMVLAAPVISADSDATDEILPNIELIVPENDFYKTYLGLTGKTGDTFSLADIKADILVIELFSMYCPYCQKEAPLVNELYEKMELVSKNGPIVKIIGLGASNSQFEVEHFRENYNVPFPLFPDKDMLKYKALGGDGTPGFIGCRIQDPGKAAIILRNSGGFYSADDFLQELISSSRL